VPFNPRTYFCGSVEVDLRRRELRVGGEPAGIGDRGLAVLEMLLEAGGALVSKDALIHRVWAGAAVEDNTLEFHISALRKALGSERGLLKTSYGLGYRLLGDWSEPPEAPAGAPRATVPRRVAPQPRLPLAGSALIGRTTPLRHLVGQVASHRLVTLTGLGGIGKTRLALEVARQLSADFGGEVHFVELASLADPALVPSALATAMGLEMGGALTTAPAVARALGERRLLIVLDNCEHVIDAAAQLAEAIMRGCARVSLLVTSRETLRIEGETVCQIAPLDVPPPHVTAAEDLRGHSAVQLFLERMRGHATDRAPADADLLLVAAICRRLDGIPLAIEFAAARAASLGLEGVHDRLDDRFSLLGGGRRTALPRQQTLRATLDWSFDLLPEAERRLLRRLSVMPGGFSLEAAGAMVWEPGGQVVQDLAHLVAKAMVTPVHPGRWRLLETVRAYATEKLAESGEAARAARCHAEFCRDLFVPGKGGRQLAPTVERLALYRRELDNVRAALDWAFAEAGDAAIGVALTAAYVPFLLHMSMLTECRERAELAVARLVGGTPLAATLEAELHVTLGLAMIYTTAQAEPTLAILRRGLEIAAGIEHPELLLRALWALFIYHFNNSHHRAARGYAERFAEMAARAGEPADVLMGHRVMGTTNHYAGDQPEARRCYDRYVAQSATPSQHRHLTWLHYDGPVLVKARLARVLWLQGLTAAARALALDTVEEARQRGHLLSVCLALGEAACPIAIMTGDFAAAESHLAALTEIATTQGFSFWTGMAHCLKGKLLVRQGQTTAGVAVLRTAIDGFGAAQQSLHYSGIVADLAEGIAASGAIDDAASVLDEALQRATQSGVEWHVPELLRLQGVLALEQARGASELHAERYFAEAVALAQRQGALFWEMRAVLSLAQLHHRRANSAEAHRLLEDIRSRCGDDADTADARAVQALWARTAMPPPL